jgi:hypothetical protein
VTPRSARAAALLLGLALLAWASFAAADPPSSASLLDTPHPGRPEALRLAGLAADALEQGREEDALALLELSVTRDPLRFESWVNRSAVAIRSCRPWIARGSAAIARRLAPDSRAAAQNHRLAARLSCEGAAEPAGAVRAEAALLQTPNDPRAWAAAAAARREAGARLVAAMHEEQAVLLGEDTTARRRLAADLEHEGLLRAALDALDPLGGEDVEAWRARLRAEVARHAEAARSLGGKLASRLPGERGESAEVLAGMAEVLLARERELERVRERLGEVLDLLGAQAVVEPWGTLRPGALWRRVLPPGEAPWPELVLRRFPSDTQVSFYRWPGGEEPTGPDRLARRLEAGAAVARSGWQACPSPVDGLSFCRTAEIETDLGGHGRTTARLWALGGSEAEPAAAAISLVGDAGCGEICREEAAEAARALLASFEPPDEPPSAAGTGNGWVLPVPPVWQPPGGGDEREQPWRSVALGDRLVIDLPPGVIGRTLAGGFPEPGGSERSVLWLRGTFVDREGRRVRIGDARWAGWVDVGPADGPPPGRWIAAREEPTLPADPAAHQAGAGSLAEAIERAGGEGSGAVVRLAGGAFEGDWLWMRRRLADRQVDVHLPVKEGAGSLSLLWIGLTLRPRGGEPPPVLVDLSTGFDVRFARFEGRRSRHDPREGVLLAAELESAVPRGFRITVSGMSGDGFPVKGRHPNGSRMTVQRWRPSEGASDEGRRRQAEALIGLEGEPKWRRERERRGIRTWTVFGRTAQGPVCAALLLPSDPAARPSFLLWLRRGDGASTASFETACGLIQDARLRR